MYLRLFLKWWFIGAAAILAYSLFVALVVNFALWQVPSVGQFVDYFLFYFRFSLILGGVAGVVATLTKRFIF